MAKIPNGAIVRVHGWVMLAKVDSGDYRIEHDTGGDVYRFFKPRGRKVLVRHYSRSVDGWLDARNANYIEVL